MVQPYEFQWMAECELLYPSGLAIAWEGLTRTLLEGLKGHYPAVKPDLKNGRIVTDFWLDAPTREDAIHASETSMKGILGEDIPLTNITVLSDEEMRTRHFGPPGDLREQRIAKWLQARAARPYFLTTLGKSAIEQPTDAIIHELNSESIED